MADGKWQMANNGAVAGTARIDLITTSHGFQGL
jgi:hypothetical protein